MHTPLHHHPVHEHDRFSAIFPAAATLSVLTILVGFFVDGPIAVFSGLFTIITQQDMLITDYIAIAGTGAALVNCGLVTLCSASLSRLSRDPMNGSTLVELGLMAGFSLFGKNFINIWPIVFGTWLYTRHRRQNFSDYADISLLSTALAPLVSYMAFGSIYASIPLGIITGVFIGFILPPISGYTYKLQNGLNLYNTGFACGLLAMIIIPIMTALGDSPDAVLFWSEGIDPLLAGLMLVLCLVSILGGVFMCGLPPLTVLRRYRWLLKTTGRMPSDYLRMFGCGPTLVNMGVNGLIGFLFLVVVGGDLNGPTMGGILTIMGFSATGKNARNIIPVMLGVVLGGLVLHAQPSAPTVQLAVLFSTTMAPISGYFGWPFGLVAGFIHSALVLQTSGPVSGMNLYNNGFSGGIIAIVLYPVIVSVFRNRRPHVTDSDYLSLFTSDAPMDGRRHTAPQPNEAEGMTDD